MSQTIYVATTSAGKLRDFATAAAATVLCFEPLPGLKTLPVPVEDGLTFADNAAIKAIAYSLSAPGMVVVADDSGLEVDALKGAPGVRSARYAADAGQVAPGEETDAANNRWLIEQMRSQTNRLCRYRCVLVAARDGVVLHEVSGTVEGTLLEAGRGTGGFGYDPLFWLAELGQSMAEISLETKHTLSHRGRAIQALVPLLTA